MVVFKRRLKFYRFRIHARYAELESEPQHFARDQNRSCHDILLRAGAPAAADINRRPNRSHLGNHFPQGYEVENKNQFLR